MFFHLNTIAELAVYIQQLERELEEARRDPARSTDLELLQVNLDYLRNSKVLQQEEEAQMQRWYVQRLLMRRQFGLPEYLFCSN